MGTNGNNRPKNRNAPDLNMEERRWLWGRIVVQPNTIAKHISGK